MLTSLKKSSLICKCVFYRPERAKRDLSDALKYFSQTVTVFLLPSAVKTKNEPFLTF